MNYYSYYRFKRDEYRHSTYILVDQQGEDIEELELGMFADNDANRERGVAKRRYIIWTVPRSENMKKYFAFTVESSPNEQFTSVEALNDKHRTFGDARKIGRPDLVLFEFSEDRKTMEMFFVKGHGSDITDKKRFFQAWNCGIDLEPNFKWRKFEGPVFEEKKDEQNVLFDFMK